MRWQYQALVAGLAAIVIGCGPREARDSGTSANPDQTTPSTTGAVGTTDTSSVGGTAGTGMGSDTASRPGMTDTAADTSKAAHKGHTDSAKSKAAKPDSGS
ncbi:MAG TPA: hypothetical protein VHJ69_10470 [Gemmatimonadales bacterium]|jgi:hypothetical protein|nr:hypothetical protein [Gemmatimonadales bacterium]